MKIKLLIVIAIGLNILTACGGGGGSGSSTPTPPTPTRTKATPTPVPTSGNILHILISQGTSTVCNNNNIPCVTVKICQPENPTNCDTVNNILIDTGSYGLRVFGSLLPNTINSLVPMTAGGESVAECVHYADNTGNWGPIMFANVTLNSSSTQESIPIQVIDANFPGMATYCNGAVTSPNNFQLNGIIGVGPWQTDQGVSNYFSCDSSGTCNVLLPPEYVTNPITKFSAGNNNGITLVFNSVAQSGVYDADGYAIFGVGSFPSNTPGSGGNAYNVFQIESGSPIPININSTFQGSVLPSFIDTGSNFLFFASPFLNVCTGINQGYFCPPTLTVEAATMTGVDGRGNSSSAIVLFSIGNADSLGNSGNTAFSNVGAVVGIPGIDWGMPFYFGRTVYMVFAGESATINGVTYPPSPNGYWIY